MFRKITLTIIVLSVAFAFAGCKKSSDSSLEKVAADSKTQPQEITEDNVAAELEKLEKEIDADQ